MIKWKTLCNKSCISCFIESITVEFVFFWFFYDFISILQFHCLMRHRRQDLNFFFLHLSPVANWMGDRHPFLKILLFGIYFWNFIFLKYKNEKSAVNSSDSSKVHVRTNQHKGHRYFLHFWAISVSCSPAEARTATNPNPKQERQQIRSIRATSIFN